MSRHLLALVPVLFTACTTAPRLSTAMLPDGRSAEVRYVSRLSPALPRDDSRTTTTNLERGVRADADFVSVNCTQYQVDAGGMASLVDMQDARCFARVASRVEVQRVLDACVADGSVRRSSRPSLRVRDGGTAMVSTTRDHAFVEGFEITRIGDGIIGDPRVATTQEGISLTVRAQLGKAPTIALDVQFEQTELIRPILEKGVRVPGSSADVVVQVPLALRQELAASVNLTQDEVLVLGGIRDLDGLHDVFVVVDPRGESDDALAQIEVERAVVGPIERR